MARDLRALERALRIRRTELQQLIGQMKSDNMNRSPVFKSLHLELKTIEDKLNTGAGNPGNG